MVTTTTILLLVPLCALVAAAYAAVGLGGGTGYLAVMTLFGVDTETMPSTALALNIVVTSAALLRFGIAGRLRASLLAPFLIPAIPAAFVGGLIDAPQRVFLGVLAIGLAAAAAAMLKTATNPDDPVAPTTARLWAVAIPSGIAIGLASGFLGIGGGIFLGPLILCLAGRVHARSQPSIRPPFSFSRSPASPRTACVDPWISISPCRWASRY